MLRRKRIHRKQKLTVDVNGLKFKAKGTKIKEKGWMNAYPNKIKEEEIPTINGTVDVMEIRTEEKETKPPRRYSAASLVKELEKRNLGTKATRSNIVETLYSRGYVREKAIEVTELGLRMEETLEEYSPIILNEGLTSEMDKKLTKIEDGDKDLDKKSKKILEEAKRSVTKIAESMTKNIDGMGKNSQTPTQKYGKKKRKQTQWTPAEFAKKEI